MRIKKEIEKIDYTQTKQFFQKRALKYNAENPYSVTMYQDNNAELVQKRNKYETKKLLSLLHPDAESRVLDLGCGIGRWADAIETDISGYCGIDFSPELIALAQNRIQKQNYTFHVGSLSNLDDFGLFNRVLMIGIMMYLNDDDARIVLEQAERHCDEHAVICMREPIGIAERLTLKEFYSDELKDEYNAIYRTDTELKQLMQNTLFNKGFTIVQEDFLFEEDESLNNRKETVQYYYILKR